MCRSVVPRSKLEKRPLIRSSWAARDGGARSSVRCAVVDDDSAGPWLLEGLKSDVTSSRMGDIFGCGDESPRMLRAIEKSKKKKRMEEQKKDNSVGRNGGV